jgi:hypothetical protein
MDVRRRVRAASSAVADPGQVGHDALGRLLAVVRAGLGCPGRITRLDRIDDRSVLIRDDLERRVEVVVEAEQSVQRGSMTNEHGMEPRVAGQPADRLVEREVATRDRPPIARGGGPGESIDQPAQLRCDRRVPHPGEVRGGPGLDGSAQVVDLADVGAAEGDDERPAARLLVDQSLRPEELERFPDGTAADPELVGDPRLHEMLAVAKATAQDLLSEDVSRILGQRPLSPQRPKPGHPLRRPSRSPARTPSRWRSLSLHARCVPRLGLDRSDPEGCRQSTIEAPPFQIAGSTLYVGGRVYGRPSTVGGRARSREMIER